MMRERCSFVRVSAMRAYVAYGVAKCDLPAALAGFLLSKFTALKPQMALGVPQSIVEHGPPSHQHDPIHDQPKHIRL